MAEVVDGRSSSDITSTGVGTVSKNRFKARVKEKARRAIDKAIADGNVTDIGQDGVDVHVARDDLAEPIFHHGQGGINNRVLPGNKKYQVGDKFPRPPGGAGKGSKASDSGEGEDDFVFHLSREEFLDLLFDDLGLPNMRRLNKQQSSETKPERAGRTSSGIMSNLDVLHSLRKKKGREWAMTTPYNREIMELLTEEEGILSTYGRLDFDKTGAGKEEVLPLSLLCAEKKSEVRALHDAFAFLATPQHKARITEIEERIGELESKKRPLSRFNDATDLSFRNYPPKPVPENKAVMFCIMDVSGSMDEEKKSKAKIFFFLLYTFLQRNHSHVDVVFIRHHTTAAEVDEQEFFYGKDTGGTMVSPALEMADDIAHERYLGKNYDVYTAQCSDGDNYESDNPRCREKMEDILSYSRGSFYVEIPEGPPQNLWRTYEKLAAERSDSFWVGSVKERKEIWPLFRKLFARKYSFEGSPANTRAVSALSPS